MRGQRPAVLVLDVNETLSDMAPMRQRFEDVGAPAGLAQTWFASVLRDGFALAAAGATARFASLAAVAARLSLEGAPLDRGLEESVRHVMEGFAELEVHPDVPDGVRRLGDLGLRLVTLSNGSAAVAEALLERAGIRDRFERLLTVEDAGIWKPAPGAYAYALEQCHVAPEQAMLVAVHPWDIDGGGRAGLATAWVDRAGAPFPEYFEEPDLSVDSLVQLADRLH